MKKLLLISAILTATMAFSAEKQQISVSKNENFEMVLHKSFEAESLAHFDRIELVSRDGKKSDIFASEGRDIEKIFEPDLDGDQVKEILVQMDLGGSGGFKEFALLKKKDQKYEVIWEETGFAGAQTTLNEDKKTGQTHILIKYSDDNFDPAKPALAVFAWQNHQLKRLR